MPRSRLAMSGPPRNSYATITGKILPHIGHSVCGISWPGDHREKQLVDSDWSCSLNGDMGDLGPFVGASFQTAEVIWEVRLTREWENHWRESAGQFALDVWAALHE